MLVPTQRIYNWISCSSTKNYTKLQTKITYIQNIHVLYACFYIILNYDILTKVYFGYTQVLFMGSVPRINCLLTIVPSKKKVNHSINQSAISYREIEIRKGLYSDVALIYQYDKCK